MQGAIQVLCFMLFTDRFYEFNTSENKNEYITKNTQNI